MRFNYTNFQDKAQAIGEQYDYGSVQAWALEYYKSLMDELEEQYKKEVGEARSYTGEYHVGRADLIREILGLPKFDWGQRPNLDTRLEHLGMRILGKRGQSNRVWVEQLKVWEDMNPYEVRDKTLMEIFNLVQKHRPLHQRMRDEK